MLDFLTLGNRNLIDNPLINKIAGIVALICVLILFIGVIVSINILLKKIERKKTATRSLDFVVVFVRTGMRIMQTERSEGAGVACFQMLMSGANLQMKDMLPNPCPPAMKFGRHLCGNKILFIESVKIRYKHNQPETFFW